MMRSKLSLLSFAVAASLMRFGVVDDEPSAAPSSSEPTGNAAGGASADLQVADTSVHDVTGGEGANAGKTDAALAEAAHEDGSATTSEGDAGSAVTLVGGEPEGHASGEGISALGADGVSVAALQSPAANASRADGESRTDANSHAEAQTFEQRVEERFLALEGYLMKLPHSIAHAFSQGSAEPEELATRALSHLFSKN